LFVESTVIILFAKINSLTIPYPLNREWLKASYGQVSLKLQKNEIKAIWALRHGGVESDWQGGEVDRKSVSFMAF